MLRIFIGTEPKTTIPFQVLSYSIKRNTKKESFEIIPLMGEDYDGPVNRPLGAGTGFSFLRWHIPKLCNYQGYAIYMDVDMLCLTDLTYLWRSDQLFPNLNSSIWCTYQEKMWQSSLMFIDCEKAKDDWPDLDFIYNGLKNDRKRKFYNKLMGCEYNKHPPQQIPSEWNHLNNFVPSVTKVLHYTIEISQPWYYPQHRFRIIWENYFKKALDNGFLTKEQIIHAVQNRQRADSFKRDRGLAPYYTRHLS